MIFLRTRRTIFALTLFIGFGLLFGQTAFGQTASVDMTFNGTGRQIFDFGATSQDAAYDVLIQNDGKIILIGGAGTQGGMVRYNSDGSLDANFGAGGSVAYGTNVFFNSGALQTDGKILVSGYSFISRFNSNGSLDTNFGTGGRTNLSTFPSTSNSYSKVLIQTDGKIIVTAEGMVGGVSRIVAYRLNADGTFDSSFDGDGAASVAVAAGSHEFTNKSAVSPDGKIIIGGGTAASTNSFVNSIFVRLNTDGSPDSTFGVNGFAQFDFYAGNNDQIYNFAVQPDGKIVAPVSARSASNIEELATARFNANGSLDTTYGTAGIFKTTRTGITVNDFIRQPDGKFVFTGFNVNGGYALGRYNADGSLDTTFTANGIFSSIRYGTLTASSAVKIQPDFKIVVAGSDYTTSTNQNFFVARFNNTTVTAARASISGKVLSGGRGVANARVELTGTGGAVRTVTTNSFGNFTLNEVETGATYVINVSAKRYTFAPQVVSVTDDVSSLVFIAQ